MKALHELAALTLGVLALGAASCGGAPVSSAPDIASKSADEILSDVVTALEGARSYHIEGHEVDEDGPSRLTGDVDASGSMRFSMAAGRTRARLVVVDSGTFISGNRAFWRSTSAPGHVADLLSSRWVKAPPAAAAVVAKELHFALPKMLAQCLALAHGSVRNKGTRRFEGRRVVVLADKGDTPGDAPGDLYVSAAGSALPLRVLQTGPPRPGTPDKSCGDEEPSTTTASDMRLSAFNEPLHIRAPAGALDLAQPAGASGALA
jgi:hypothetical protein